KCAVLMHSLESRSAMVRETFNILSYARADRLSFSIAVFNKLEHALSRWQIFFSILLLICALQCTSSFPAYRCSCNFLAAITRCLIPAESSVDLAFASSLNATGVTSTCRSMRSRSGPETLFKYFCTAPGGQVHSFSG